ncbi:MAG: hypothetical protein QW076_01820 [Candidatus Anstonellales archaeon]
MIDFFLKSSEDTKFLCESYSSSSDWTIIYIGMFFLGLILFGIISFVFIFLIDREQQKDWGKKVSNTTSFWIYIFTVILILIIFIPYRIYSDIKNLPVLWKCESGVFYDLAMFVAPLLFICGVVVGIITLFIIFRLRKSN